LWKIETKLAVVEFAAKKYSTWRLKRLDKLIGKMAPKSPGRPFRP
jgi:hypothetical protein